MQVTIPCCSKKLNFFKTWVLKILSVCLIFSYLESSKSLDNHCFRFELLLFWTEIGMSWWPHTGIVLVTSKQLTDKFMKQKHAQSSPDRQNYSSQFGTTLTRSLSFGRLQVNMSKHGNECVVQPPIGIEMVVLWDSGCVAKNTFNGLVLTQVTRSK